MAWTFQSLIDDRMTVTAYCHASACNHNATLDLKRMRDRFGPDAPAMRDDVLPMLYCSKCGGKKLGLIYTPPSPGNRDSAPNRYAKAKGK